jgi:RNA polymerase sigma-70 factor (ECF subfamily)
MTVRELAAVREDGSLVAALREGDERAFRDVVERYHRPLVRVAMSFVHDRAIAEEVVQETWLAVIKGLDTFRGESSLKTWIFRILTNRAQSRAIREWRSVPFSSLEGDPSESAVDADRFFDESHPRWAGHWASPPANWDTLPEERLLAGETLECIRRAIETLPTLQQQVISLRDVEGWPAEEVCDALAISDVHQRVLLHRARSRVRAALERHIVAATPTPSA